MKKVYTPVEIARKGGKTTLKKYGSAHFKKIAEKRWKEEREKKKK